MGDIMNITEYAHNIFKIDNHVQKSKTPRDMVMEEDDLPYDFIGPDSSGVLQKMLYLSEEEYIPVYDLLTYTDNDIEKMDPSSDIRVLYENYMTLVDRSDPAFLRALSLAKEWEKVRL